MDKYAKLTQLPVYTNIGVVSKLAVRTFFIILLAELESLLQKNDTTQKLTLLLKDFVFYPTFCIFL